MTRYLKVPLLLLALLFMPGAAWSQPQLTKLTIAEPGRLFQYAPLYYAIERGYFQREGLDVSMLTVGRRDLAMKAVIAGEAFASVHDPVEAALARSRGADVKLIAPVVNVAALWLVVDKDITLDSKTWRGKSMALPTPPNTPNSIFIKELRENGWNEVDRTTYKPKGDDDASHVLKILYGAFGTDLSLMMNG
jgi:NitT/TauT family transport system substrate-binding protein